MGLFLYMKRPRENSAKRQGVKTLANVSNTVSPYLNVRSLAKMCRVSKGVRNAARAELNRRPVKPLLDFFGPRLKAMQEFLRNAETVPLSPQRVRKMARKHRALFRVIIRPTVNNNDNNDNSQHHHIEVRATHKPSGMRIAFYGLIRDGEIEDKSSIAISVPSLNVYWPGGWDTMYRPNVSIDVRESLGPGPNYRLGSPYITEVAGHMLARYVLLGERHWCARPFTNAEAIQRIENLNIRRRGPTLKNQPVAFPEMVEVILGLFGHEAAAAAERRAVEMMKFYQKRACKAIRDRRAYEFFAERRPKASAILRERALTGRSQRVAAQQISQLDRGLRRVIPRIRR